MEDFKDYKLWCKQNNLKENSYESLKQYYQSKRDIIRLSEELVQAFTLVRIKKDKVRSAVFTHELLQAIDFMVAAAKEEGRKTDEPGHPGYMLEKLNQAKRYLDTAIRYYITIQEVENEI